jgi:poly-gamma-glutamate capsule biosynthesis protein CapA/YwtB (metallophosphatase superfamily)
LANATVTLFLCGDVMTGRGVDQILPRPSRPEIFEPYVKDARDYVRIAETANGPIPKPANYSYIWGDILGALDTHAADARIINLETAVTTSDDYWKGKGINYRMHPENIHCLTAAKIDLCVLANNHVIDWGYSGLVETLETLRKAGIKTAGAGLNPEEAEAPAIFEIPGKGRVLVWSFGSPTSGIPDSWAASRNNPGLNFLDRLSEENVKRISEQVKIIKRKGDIAVASLHWGGNWGYEIPSEQIEFAHNLIDHAGIDIIHGNSSHHVKAIEIYRNKLILYGCGDFLNDYEGIRGYEEFRDDLGLMYFPSLNPATGELVGLKMIPTRIRNLRVNLAARENAMWLREVLNRESEEFGVRVGLKEDNSLVAGWKRIT